MRIILHTLLWSAFCTLPAWAATVAFKETKTLPLQQEFATSRDWRVTTYQPDGDDAETGDIAAKLCFWFDPHKKQEHCNSVTSALPGVGLLYHYQTVKELSVVLKPHLVKLVARYSGGGSGALERVSFWRYDAGADSFSSAGAVTLTEQGEYQILRDGILITADAYWSEGETHFAPHRFAVEAYQYRPKGGYTKILGYLTANKYPSFDDTDKIDVISHELPEITKRSAAAKLIP